MDKHLFAYKTDNSAEYYYFGGFFGFIKKKNVQSDMFFLLAKPSERFAYLCFDNVKMY